MMSTTGEAHPTPVIEAKKSEVSRYYSYRTFVGISDSAKSLASKLAEKAASIDYKGMKKSIASAGNRLSAYLQELQNNRG